MPDKIIQTLTTSDNRILRIRERGIMERFGSHAFALEVLIDGAFKVLVDGKYKTEEDAIEGLNKIYRLDNIAQIRRNALRKLKPGFHETLKGTKDYDLYVLLESLVIVEFKFFDDRWPRAICRTQGNDSVHLLNQFLTKYGYAGEVKAIEIEVMNDDYDFNLVTYKNDYSLYNSMYEQERENAAQYKLLFESKLNPQISLLTL